MRWVAVDVAITLRCSRPHGAEVNSGVPDPSTTGARCSDSTSTSPAARADPMSAPPPMSTTSRSSPVAEVCARSRATAMASDGPGGDDCPVEVGEADVGRGVCWSPRRMVGWRLRSRRSRQCRPSRPARRPHRTDSGPSPPHPSARSPSARCADLRDRRRMPMCAGRRRRCPTRSAAPGRGRSRSRRPTSRCPRSFGSC